MQSILAMRKHYPGYTAQTVQSETPSMSESVEGLTAEERREKLDKIETGRRKNDIHYVTWEFEGDTANPLNW